MRVLVTGATGFVGREVLRQLHAVGHSVRVLARNTLSPSVRDLVPAFATELRSGNVLNAESLRDAAEGCEAVIHLVGIISEIGEQTFENVHLRATENLLAEARRAGARRWIQMSALGTRPDAPSRYHRTKWAAEETVRASGLDWTILRPSLIYGPEDHFVNLFARVACWSPMLPVMGNGRNKLQPVNVEDVARCFVGALTQPASIGQTVDVCGPEQFTFLEILDTILAIQGKRRFKLCIPLPIARFQAALLEKIFPALLRQAPPLNRDQLLMLQEDNVGDPQPATALFQLEARSFAEGIAAYLKQNPRRAKSHRGCCVE